MAPPTARGMAVATAERAPRVRSPHPPKGKRARGPDSNVSTEMTSVHDAIRSRLAIRACAGTSRIHPSLAVPRRTRGSARTARKPTARCKRTIRARRAVPSVATPRGAARVRASGQSSSMVERAAGTANSPKPVAPTRALALEASARYRARPRATTADAFSRAGPFFTAPAAYGRKSCGRVPRARAEIRGKRPQTAPRLDPGRFVREIAHSP